MKRTCNYMFIIDGNNYGCKNEATVKDIRTVHVGDSQAGYHYFYWCPRHKPYNSGGIRSDGMKDTTPPIRFEALPESS